MLHIGSISHQYRVPDDQNRLDDKDEIDLGVIVQFVRKSRRLIAVWVALGFLVGCMYLAVAPSYYSASTVLLLEDQTLQQLPGAVIGADTADSTYVESQIQVIQSDEVVRRVVDERRLLDDPEFGRSAKGLRATVMEYLPFASAVFSPAAEASLHTQKQITAHRIKRALMIVRAGQSNAVEITFTSQKAERSADIANAIAQGYVDSRLQLKQQVREQAAAQLRQRLEEIRDKAFNTDPTGADQTVRSTLPSESARERFREQQNTAETYRTLYANLLQRYTEAIQPLSLAGARVITPAEPPGGRSSPNSSLILSLAIIGGLAIGGAHAILRTLGSSSLQSVDELGKVVGIDFIAAIPKIRNRAWKFIDPGSGTLQGAYMMQATVFDEALSSAAVYLQGSEPRAHGRVLGVASVNAGNGASLVAIHLARTYARSGYKTLLIDANWRGGCHRGDHLLGTFDQDLDKSRVVYDLGGGTLDVLVLRAHSPITDVSASRSIIATLLQVRSEYSQIVVDFDALSVTADAAAASLHLDDMVIVVEAGSTRVDAIRAVFRSLARGKTPWAILNKAKAN
ncbi:Wzz/FepE/Etk N-terminal domain-containing protein [Microvirga arabica]|uniref:Wzz/FepE/Etk N-terminal domain-containing protein n=1 Tax=Microvirga arabica TaxID=1128671 RepID=A0ABV6YDI9_9HYPH